MVMTTLSSTAYTAAIRTIYHDRAALEDRLLLPPGQDESQAKEE